MSARVKPLVWEDDSDHWHPETRWRAKGCFGEHYEIELSDGAYTLSHKALMGDIEADALAEAKAAAQADYEARILAALEPQDTPAVAELVALRAEVAAHNARAEVMHRRAQRAEGALDAAIADGEGWQSLYARKTRDDTGFRMALGGIMRKLKNRRAALTPEAKS